MWTLRKSPEKKRSKINTDSPVKCWAIGVVEVLQMKCKGCEYESVHRSGNRNYYSCLHPNVMLHTALMPWGYARRMTAKEHKTRPMWCQLIRRGEKRYEPIDNDEDEEE